MAASSMQSGPLPCDGDVVVAAVSHSAVRYVVCQYPGVTAQVSSSSRDEALQLARRFAQRQGTDLWYRDDGLYRLLEAYRRDAAS